MSSLSISRAIGVVFIVFSLGLLGFCAVKIGSKMSQAPSILEIAPKQKTIAVIEARSDTVLPVWLEAFFETSDALSLDLDLDVESASLIVLEGEGGVDVVYGYRLPHGQDFSLMHRERVSHGDDVYYTMMVSDFLLLGRDQRDLVLFGSYSPMVQVPEVQRFLNNTSKDRPFLAYVQANAWVLDALSFPAEFVDVFKPLVEGLGGVGFVGRSKDEMFYIQSLHALSFDRDVPIIPSARSVSLEQLQFIPENGDFLVFLDSAFGDKFVQFLQHLRHHIPSIVLHVDEVRSAVYERVYLDVIDDIMQLLREDYVVYADVSRGFLSVISKTDPSVHSSQTLERIFRTLKAYLPLSFPVEKTVVLRDGTKGTWLIADPDRELREDTLAYADYEILGLSFVSDQPYGFYATFVEDQLVFSTSKEGVIEHIETYLGGVHLSKDVLEDSRHYRGIKPDSYFYARHTSNSSLEEDSPLRWMFDVLEGFQSLSLSQVTYRDDIITEAFFQ